MAGPSTIGRYEVVRPLGVGGMGEVWLCRSVGPQGFATDVVVKRVRADRAARARSRELFVDEARLAARLSHPHIVNVFDFGEDDDGLFLAMEHVAGRDLAEALAAGPPATPALAAHIGRSVARALAYAHGLSDDHGAPLGLVHRDVSPHNVLLGYAGEIKLSDFGVARSRAQLRESTGDGIKGKLRYLSPEQARGEALDGRSDVYALGLTLLEAITGRPAVDAADEAGLLAAAAKGGVPVPDDLPPPLRRLLRRCLAPAPEERPDAGGLADALDRYVLEHAADAAELRVGPWLQARLTPRAAQEAGPRAAGSTAATVGRRPGRMGRLLALLAGAASLVGAILLLRSEPPTSARRAAPAKAAPAAGTEEASPPAARGWLEVQVRPHGKLRIDGKPAGAAPVKVELDAGEHRIRASNKALGRSKTVKVVVRPGERTRTTIDLR